MTVQDMTDIVITVAAVIALVVAIWRSAIADKQAMTASRGLSNEQFKTGVGLLGHENMAIRLGGVRTLANLADQHPGSFHVQVMEVFIAFLAFPPRFQGGRHDGEIDFDSADTVKIVDIINNRTTEQRHVEEQCNFDLAWALEATPFPMVSGIIRPDRPYPPDLPSLKPRPEPTKPPSP